MLYLPWVLLPSTHILVGIQSFSDQSKPRPAQVKDLVSAWVDTAWLMLMLVLFDLPPLARGSINRSKGGEVLGT